MNHESGQATLEPERVRTAWLTKYVVAIGVGVLALGIGIMVIVWRSTPSTTATADGQLIDTSSAEANRLAATTGSVPASTRNEVNRNNAVQTVRGGPVATAKDDLNLLLRLLSQNIRVGLVEIARPIDPLWLKDIRKLQTSSNSAVAQTARAVEGSAKKREEAFKILEAAEAKNEELRKEMPKNGSAILGLLDSPSSSDIDAARASGQITAAEAEAYEFRKAENERALLEVGTVAFMIAANNSAANKTVRAMRNKAELQEADAVAEHLVPAIRARAGAKLENPPLRITAGLGGNLGGLQQDDICILPSIVSTAKQPLTQLTILLEIRVPPGRRRAVAFIPNLEPGRGVQIAPIPYDLSTLGYPRGPVDKTSVIRYSIWCDQFTHEGEEVPIAPSKDARVAYCSLVSEPGRNYDFEERRFGSDRTTYRLEFTEMTPDKNQFRVKGNLSLYERRNHDKPIKVTPFDGVFRGADSAQSPAQKSRQGSPPNDGTRKPPSIFDRARKGMPPEKTGKAPPPPAGARPALPTSRLIDAVLAITTGSEESEIALYIGDDGSVGWFPMTGLLRNRMVRSTEQIQKVRAVAGILQDARDLAMGGKKDEAAKILKDFIATGPGEKWVAQADLLLKNLDWLAARGDEMKKFIDARRNDPRPPSAMGDFGKGLGGFGGLQPPGGIGGRGTPGAPGKGQNPPNRP